MSPEARGSQSPAETPEEVVAMITSSLEETKGRQLTATETEEVDGLVGDIVERKARLAGRSAITGEESNA